MVILLLLFISSSCIAMNSTTKRLSWELAEATEKGKVDRVSSLLRKKASIVLSIGGKTVFHRAARKGFLEIVTILLAHGASLKTKDRRGRTALYCAIAGKNLEIAKLLISLGADCMTRDNNNQTLLHRAARGGFLEGIRLLLAQGASVNTKDSRGNTPLHCASQFGHIDTIDLLVKHNAHLLTQNIRLRTPLHRAASKRKNQACKKLLLCMATRYLTETMPRIKERIETVLLCLKRKKVPRDLHYVLLSANRTLKTELLLYTLKNAYKITARAKPYSIHAKMYISPSEGISLLSHYLTLPLQTACKLIDKNNQRPCDITISPTLVKLLDPERLEETIPVLFS